MPITFLNRVRGGSPRAFDADVLAWRDAVIANGGPVSLARLIVVDQFVFGEKAAGLWALTDDYLPLCGENAVQALTSLKQRRLATAVNSPTFTTDRDFVTNGSTSYIDTGFIPASHGVNWTVSAQRLAVYERTNVVNAASVSAGAYTGAVNKGFITNQVGSGMLRGGLNTADGSPGNFAISPADSRGLKSVSRAGGGTTMLGYDRGVRLTDATGLTVSNASRPTHSVFIGGLNFVGSLTNTRAGAFSFVVLGGPLSDAQEAAQYANIQALHTAVGAQV
ncbi:MAG: hypothetical protein EPO41_02805 [Reyranella sp.]|uniref:hypothetical protein n=1 Tax=Reyranella sp. TaxID=1929291 RepID=UPI0011F43782|nr:hypothetical protein [Reyranella sp.]TAJ97353.1 MAG: hypothetical protein EPO41_02805 [Reyranella sp.]